MAGKYIILASLCAIVVLLVVFLPMAMKPASPADNQTAEKDGECLIWDTASQDYASMAKLCARDEDCAAYAQVFLNYAATDVATLDVSKTKCSPTTFSKIRDASGNAYSCSVDRDCFLAFLDNSKMHRGDVPPEVSDSLAEVFVCRNGAGEAPSMAKTLWAEKSSDGGGINEVLAD
jgi:hypothetical protein